MTDKLLNETLRSGIEQLDAGNTQAAIATLKDYCQAHQDDPDSWFYLGDALAEDGRTAETCNVYNMIKMARMLFSIAPDVRYADFQERALFNHILGSMDPQDGSTCYMVPVGQRVSREYQNMTRDFTCCVGSGMESHALHADGLYYESGDRLWVNVYAPSTARWRAAGVRLTMDTSFPEGEDASLALQLEAPRTFTLALRRPWWAGSGFAVKVNGAPVARVPAPGAYVEIARRWKTGDRVTLVLPKALHLQPLPDNGGRVAIMWGPLVLAGDLGEGRLKAGELEEQETLREGKVLMQQPVPQKSLWRIGE